jgi:hypothetical protein
MLRSSRLVLHAALCLSIAGCSDSGSGSAAKTGTGGKSAAGKGGGAGKAGAGAAGKGAAGNGAAGGEAATGDALKAPDLTWTFIEFPDTHCRDNSPAGLALSLSNGSKNVMIFLQGGGACFDIFSCAMNATDVSGSKGEQTSGIFDRSNPDNPVKDWSYVFIPYCTGDVHAGTNDQGSVPSVTGTQHFMGRRNMEAFLKRIVPTFRGAQQVLLTGSSAGGFGAAANAELVQTAFGTIPVTMIDDSGPPMSSKYLPPCLQDKWRTIWGFDDSLLTDCGADCPDHSDYDVDYAKHVAKTAGKQLGGLIETMDDGTITTFYGYGANDCTGNFTTPVSADTFGAGLLDFRKTMQDTYPNFGTYYISGTQHTWLQQANFYTTSIGGTRLVDWIKHIIDGSSAEHIGP